MSRIQASSKFILWLCVMSLLGSAYAQDAVHAVVGVVTKIDKTAKTISVKTADGAEQAFKYTARTTVRDSREAGNGVKRGVVETYFAGKEGSHVMLRYMGKGTDKTATVVDDFGKEALKGGKGTITKVDRATRTVAIKTEDGAESTYRLGSDAIVETDHGVVRGTTYVAKEGDRVVVHYTETEGAKVVKFFKKL
jgi:hypothetical protein